MKRHISKFVKETLPTGSITKKKSLRPELPSEVFKACPSCGSDDLLKMECDCICLDCSWDSAESYVAAGGMDDLIGAVSDHIYGAHSHKRLQKNEEQNSGLNFNKNSLLRKEA